MTRWGRPNITLRLDRDEIEALNAHAAARHQDRSAFLRWALRRWLRPPDTKETASS